MANNPLRQDSNGTAQALRSKLQGLGAGTYDPEFMRQYRQVSVMTPTVPPVPFIPQPNPAENKSQLVKKRMLIFSGDRDERVGSKSSDFQITLNTSLDEVVKVELRSFQSPSGIYNISSSNQSFQMAYNWTLANSPYYVANPPAGLVPPASSVGNFAGLTVSVQPGSYTPDELVKAVARAMNDTVSYYIGRFADPSIPWITGQLGESGQFELYSLDLGLTFGIQTTGIFTPFGVVSGLPNGTYGAIATGGIYGTTDYYYLAGLPGMLLPALPDYSTLCVQSIALGNNLVATEGGSAGFNAFTTVPIADSSSPILVRFDNTLDSTYFDVQKNAYNNLKTIDFKITDKDGFIVVFQQDITMEFDVVQKIKPGTLGQ